MPAAPNRWTFYGILDRMALSSLSALPPYRCGDERSLSEGGISIVVPAAGGLEADGQWRAGCNGVGAQRERVADRAAKDGSHGKASKHASSMSEEEMSQPRNQALEMGSTPSSARASSRGLVRSLWLLGRRLIARGSTRLGRWPTLRLAIDTSF